MVYESIQQISAAVLIIALLVYIAVKDVCMRKIGKIETFLLVCLVLMRCEGIAEALAAGLLCAAALELVNLLFFQLKGLGGGDIRLMFVSGCLLGMAGGFVAFLAGGVLSLLSAAGCFWLRGNRDPAEFAAMEIPFGAFLSAGMILVMFADRLFC
ncbi:MAG: hypothetical protein PUG60_04655 [Lachnospiraceae bacterium]|nr:hypothetical protein [Lachnospiraceae bacterium]MDY4971636.1 hypothetical protein [Lachnospiraceae bacterium]